MTSKNITFLSSKKMGLSSDLKYFELYLNKYGLVRDSYLRFFCKNEKGGNAMVNQGYRDAKKDFCKDADNIICVDASLPAGRNCFKDNCVRILLAVPMEYQFKNMLLKKKNTPKYKTFKHFTHIIVGSPFTETLFQKVYQLDDTELIGDVCMPTVWSLQQESIREEKIAWFDFYFPEAKGRKILSIIISGKVSGKEKFIKEFDIQSLFEYLGDDWFVVTNSVDLLENVKVFEQKNRERFGYLKKIMLVQDLLFVSDAVVTNNGNYAAYFSTRNKPVYCLKIINNYFERYMQVFHPDLILNSFNDLLVKNLGEQRIENKAQNAFRDLFSYKKLKSPYETIYDICNN